MLTTHLEPSLLDSYRKVQRLAYECAESVARELRPGMTEREACEKMRAWLVARGCDDWFHKPFAWFGERSSFWRFKWPTQFFPGDRALEDGMPFILDLAPVTGGVTGDIGYASVLGKNALHAKLVQDLAPHRELILAGVKAGKTLREIYEDVDRLLAKQGYDCCHKQYPFGTLAHRVEPLEGRGKGITIGGFGIRAQRSLARDLCEMRRTGRSPIWNASPKSDHLATPGLWAVEPHFGLRGIGVKFEELLVVTDSDAYWLDDDLPHVRRFGATS